MPDYGQIVCAKCKKPCDFEETGLYKSPGLGFGGSDFLKAHLRAGGRVLDTTQFPPTNLGWRLIRAHCHGETADVLMSEEQAMAARTKYYDEGRKIFVFEETPALPAPEPLTLEDSQKAIDV